MKKFIIFFGLLIAFTMFFVCTTYAAEPTYPALPTPAHSNCHYVIFKFENVHYLYMLTSDNSLASARTFVAGSGTLRFEVLDHSTGFTVNQYKLVDGAWTYIKTEEKSATSYKAIVYDTVKESNYDIYRTSDGEDIFFQKTPTLISPTLEEIVEEETLAMAQKVTQTMKIILLCGVGCLALLISLPVLLKVLRRFLSK